jgi:SPP1 gp7 family putative phage head morphogenesis protein
MSDFGVPSEPRTAVDQFLDALTRHQIGLLRIAGALRETIVDLLDSTEADLRRQINDRLRRNESLVRSASARRIERLLTELTLIRRAAHRGLREVFVRRIREIALAEPQFIAAIAETVIPVQVSFNLPSPQLLRTIVSSQPFQGRTLGNWLTKFETDDLERIRREINIGVVQGQSVPQIARRVVGSTQLRGTDGITAVTRREAATLTRTAVNHYANQTRQEFAKANPDIFDREIYIATLDGRTTKICASLDGQVFPVGQGPIPPLHPNCRSLRSAYFDEGAIGERPLKPFTERKLLREFAQQEGLDRVPTKRRDLPFGTKTKFDQFSRRRARELTGRTPSKTTFAEVLDRAGTEFQNDYLGPTRARLYRAGLTLDKFVDGRGGEFTLRELARQHGEIFQRAGFEPSAFFAR